MGLLNLPTQSMDYNATIDLVINYFTATNVRLEIFSRNFGISEKLISL